MATVLLQEDEGIESLLKRFILMTHREGIFQEIRLRSKGAVTPSQKRREKKKIALGKRNREAAKQAMKRLLGFYRDAKPSNDYGQNTEDVAWATGDDTWNPDLSKLFSMEYPNLEFLRNYRANRASAIRRNLFRFGDQFRKKQELVAQQEEIVPSTHVCVMAKHKFGRAKGLLVVRTKDDDGRPRDKFSFPGGGVDEGETPQQAAVREYLEETGLSVEVSGPPLFKTYFAQTKHTFICFPGQVVGGIPEMGEEVVEMLLVPEEALGEIAGKSLSPNHFLSYRKFEKRQEYLAKLKQLAAEAKKAAEERKLRAKARKAKGRFRSKQNPAPSWIEINNYRRPRPLGPDEIEGGSMYKLSAEMAELTKLGFKVEVKLCGLEERDKSILLQSGGMIRPEEDGCFLKNGRNQRFFVKVSFPTDLKDTRLVAAVQQGSNGHMLEPIWVRSAGEDRAAVGKLVSTFETQPGYTAKFPDNSLLLILVKDDQRLEVWRVGVATRIYDEKNGGAHHFVVVQATGRAQLYRDAGGNIVTDDNEYHGFNRWPDMQSFVRKMVGGAVSSLPAFKAKTAKKATTKIPEGQARVIWFDILKGFGYAETRTGPRKVHWEQMVESPERLPYLKAGDMVKYKEVFDTISGLHLAGVEPVAKTVSQTVKSVAEVKAMVRRKSKLKFKSVAGHR